MEQQIQFTTTSDGVSICYATVGSGPPLVKAPNWMTHIEYDWQTPLWRHWWEELARDHYFVRFDQRGCGLSDWSVEDFSFEARTRDLEAVVAAVGLDTFALLGISQGGASALTYAVDHPQKVSHLVLYGSFAVGWAAGGETKDEEREALLTLTSHGWGRDDPIYRQLFTSKFLPDGTPEQMGWFNELQRMSASPENAVRTMRATSEIDIRHLLSRVAVPTLVLHARNDAQVPFEKGRRLAAGIPNARFIPLESKNHLLLEDEPAWPVFLSEVRKFLGTEAGDGSRASASVAEESAVFTTSASPAKLGESHIFISHVEEDYSIAISIVNALEGRGYSTWYYERDSVPGPAYLAQMGDAIDQSRAVVLLISPMALGSNQMTTEVVRAHESNKPFIPLLKGISHGEFQARAPVWRQALGASTSIAVSDERVVEVVDRVIKGLEALGIKPD